MRRRGCWGYGALGTSPAEHGANRRGEAIQSRTRATLAARFSPGPPLDSQPQRVMSAAQLCRGGRETKMHPCVGLHPGLQKSRGGHAKKSSVRFRVSVRPVDMITQAPRMSSRYDVGRPNRIPSENSDGVGPARTYPPHLSPKGPGAFVLGCALTSGPVFRRDVCGATWRRRNA